MDTFCFPPIVVAVFAKPPVPGLAKTRLIPALGAEGAAALADRMLRDTLATIRSDRRLLPVLATTEPGHPALPADVEHWDQGGGDLGVRIDRMLSRGLDRSAAGVVIGADTPSLRAFDVVDLISAVVDDRYGAALGPTVDGGFWGLAVGRATVSFEGLPWSSGAAAAATIARLRENGVPVWIGAVHRDIDRPADLR